MCLELFNEDYDFFCLCCEAHQLEATRTSTCLIYKKHKSKIGMSRLLRKTNGLLIVQGDAARCMQRVLWERRETAAKGSGRKAKPPSRLPQTKHILLFVGRNLVLLLKPLARRSSRSLFVLGTGSGIIRQRSSGFVKGVGAHQ